MGRPLGRADGSGPARPGVVLARWRQREERLGPLVVLFGPRLGPLDQLAGLDVEETPPVELMATVQELQNRLESGE